MTPFWDDPPLGPHPQVRKSVVKFSFPLFRAPLKPSRENTIFTLPSVWSRRVREWNFMNFWRDRFSPLFPPRKNLECEEFKIHDICIVKWKTFDISKFPLSFIAPINQQHTLRDRKTSSSSIYAAICNKIRRPTTCILFLVQLGSKKRIVEKCTFALSFWKMDREMGPPTYAVIPCSLMACLLSWFLHIDRYKGPINPSTDCGL